MNKKTYSPVRQLEYRNKNLEKIRKNARDWARRNKKPYYWSDGKRESQRKYRAKYKAKLANKRNAYVRNRIQTDVNYRLRWLFRSRISIAIKRQCGSKAYKSMELLGCSIQTAREHLEKQFTDDMNWENHGKWEIDHIIPVSIFNLTKPEEQKKAFHYTNLQPLMKLANRTKGSRTK